MKTIGELWEASFKNYANLAAVRWLNKKEILERSYKELNDDIVALRKGLATLGYHKAHIAVIGTSSVTWVGAYFSVTAGDNVAVPLDAGLPAEDLIELLNRSNSEGLFIAPGLKAMLPAVKEQCPKIKNIWLLQETTDEEYDTVNDLKAAGNDDVELKTSTPDDIATIIYTSGTTGKSKGVMLTQQNFTDNVISVPYTDEPGGTCMTVLPIHHAFCLVMDWLKGFSLGACVCINDSLMHMIRNISIFKPKIILMVPLMIETIYKRIAATDPSIPREILAEKLFGGNLKIIFTGGAHLDPFYIEEFEKLGILVLEGYGMSECSPVISNNMPENHKVGSIGKPLPNAEVKISETGEILVRGTSVMKGYYDMPEETAETLKDGWLHTGDKGYIDEDGFLFINGRVKNLIILSNGENISPEEIENKLALAPLVGEVIITGENNGLTARIYPDQDVVGAKGLEGDALKAALQDVLDTYNKNQPTYRQITGLVVRKNPFIKSATKKIKRAEAEIDE